MTHCVHATRLAISIVHDSFGELPGKLCESFVRKGALSLHALCTETQLSTATCKQCLLILLQHNCAAAWQDTGDEHFQSNPGSCVTYHILLDRILHRIRFPRMLAHVRDCLGAAHELLLEGLLEHGRLREDQLLERTTTIIQTQQVASHDELMLACAQLAESNFIEPVPLGYTKFPREIWSVKAEGNQQTRQATSGKQCEQKNTSSQQQEKHLATSSDIVHRPFRHNAIHSGSVHQRRPASGDDRVILWRVNTNEFNVTFRHISCAALVREKVSDVAGQVTLVMLNLAHSRETLVKEERSAPLSEDVIISKVRERAIYLDQASVRKVLTSLEEDTSELISSVGDNQTCTTYCVNMRRIVDLIRMKEVEAIVRERFGGPACRIFRLLLLKRQLEQKQIAEMAMIPIKDTRELLYKLLKAEYVQVQEIARTSDHAPSRTFYLWRIDLMRVIEQIGHELYKATFSVRGRLMHELCQEREVIALLERAQHGKGGVTPTSIALTQYQRENLERVRIVASRLEISLMKLDELILIFNVF